jgi:hypothetical protein
MWWVLVFMAIIVVVFWFVASGHVTHIWVALVEGRGGGAEMSPLVTAEMRAMISYAASRAFPVVRWSRGSSSRGSTDGQCSHLRTISLVYALANVELKSMDRESDGSGMPSVAKECTHQPRGRAFPSLSHDNASALLGVVSWQHMPEP